MRKQPANNAAINALTRRSEREKPCWPWTEAATIAEMIFICRRSPPEVANHGVAVKFVAFKGIFRRFLSHFAAFAQTCCHVRLGRCDCCDSGH
jgi:hypothetical protein